MKLSELVPFLEQNGKRPSRALSQNFLIDPNISSKIVKTANIQPHDTILEVGPGPGALTALLLEKGARVIAVEKDPIFAEQLLRLQTEDQRLESTAADFLLFDLKDLPSSLKVVANLPYNITAPAIERLFTLSGFSSMTLMVQKEVARRLAANKNTKEYGSFSLFFQYHARIQSLFTVPPSCFYPKPKVDSAVIHCEKVPPQLKESAPFFALVRKAFQKRRKMIRVSLKEDFPDIESALFSAGVKKEARPEDLSLEGWISLHRALSGLPE